jgi:hypothetical protein
MTARFALIGATVIALALSFDFSAPALAQTGMARHQKAETLAPRLAHPNPPVPFEAFGALAGAVTSIAAAEHQRESYGTYYSPSYAGPSRQKPPLVTRPVAGRP